MYELKKLIVIFLLVPLIGCSNRVDTMQDGREIALQDSPDQHSKAIVWLPELGGLGATVSQPYQVWIQNLQGKDQKSLVFEADKTDGVRLLWSGTNELEICYKSAQITQFRNFFVVADQKSPEIYKVEIILRKAPSLDDC